MNSIINILKLAIALFAVMAMVLPSANLMAQSPVTEKNGWATIEKCNENSPNYMLAHSSLVRGGCIISKNGVYWVMVRDLQSFSVTVSNAPGKNGATPSITYWNSGDRSPHSTHTSLEMQGDGNLVVYNKAISAGGTSTWASGTDGTNADILIITDWGELVLQRGGPIGESGENPSLNQDGRYKKQWAKLDRNKIVKGFGGIHTPTVGLHILSYVIHNITTITEPANLSSSSTAHYTALNCGKGANKPIGVTQTLTASIQESQSWGFSTTKGKSTEVGVEIGVEASAGIVKASVSSSIKNTLSSSQTHTYESTEIRSKQFSFQLNAEVDPGYYQAFMLQVNRTRTIVPYTALEVVHPTGYGPYLSRTMVKSEFINTSGRSAQGSAGDLIKCLE